MRVLHVGKFFPPHPGGIERCTADLAGALSRRGVDVAVVAHAEPGSPGDAVRHDAVEVRLAACHGQLLYVPLSPSFPRLLARTIRGFRPQVLHLHLPNPSAFFALMSPAARRLPWVVHWHADIPLDSRRRLLHAGYTLYRPWERAMLRHATAVIATSQAYRDSSTALAPWRDKTEVIELGIPELEPQPEDPAPAAPASTPAGAAPAMPDALRILAVGRLSYFKGVDILLRALAATPSATLEVVGDGECRPSLERLARELGIGARVRFCGRIGIDAEGSARLRAAYRQADVFCLPSIDRAESFGLVLLEAMRARLPVVASAIPGSGVGHVVRDEETGLLVAPGDSAALARALGRLAADAGLRSRLGAAGQRRWREAFTLDRSVDRVLALYRRILDPAAARA